MTMLKYIAIFDDAVVIYLVNTCLFLISWKLNYQPIHIPTPLYRSVESKDCWNEQLDMFTDNQQISILPIIPPVV